MRIRRLKFGKSNLLDRLSGRFRPISSKRYQPENISQVLERVAEKYPTKDAVVCDNIRLTFSQLKEQADRLESGLSTLDITHGDWVAIMLPNCPEFVISFLAIAKIGAIVVPVDIYYQQPELERLLHDGHITTLITSSEFLETAKPSISKCAGFKNLILKESNYKGYSKIWSIFFFHILDSLFIILKTLLINFLSFTVYCCFYAMIFKMISNL